MSATIPSKPPGLGAWITLLGCLALLLRLYWPTAASIVESWSKDPFAHGYFVVPMAVYLAWTRRKALESLSPAPSFWALSALGLLAFVWLLGNLTATRVVQQVCLIGMVMAFAWCVLGRRTAQVLVFPVAFLLFALPLGDQLVPMLQDLTARFAVKMLRLVSIPVLLEGHLISIPGSSWQVAEACSGINYLVSSLAIGYVYAGTVYRGWVHRLSFFAASALVPIVANGLRVYTTIFIASKGASSIASGMEHNLYGLFLFGSMTYLLLATCGGWRENVEEKSAPAGLRKAPGTLAYGTFAAAILGVLLVGAAPLSARLLPLQDVPDAYLRPTSQALPPWAVVDTDTSAWTPKFISPSAEEVKIYDSGNGVVKLYMAYYSANQPAVKLATASNVLFEEPWRAAAKQSVAVWSQDKSFRVEETVLESPSKSLVVWSWYRVDGTSTSSDSLAKLLLAKARLFRSPQGSAAIAVATEDRPGKDARAILRDFLSSLSLSGMGGRTQGAGSLHRPA